MLFHSTVPCIHTQVNWPALLRQIFGKSIPSNTTVVVHYPEILQQVQAIINVTEPRVVHNTLLMLVVRDLALELFKVPPGLDKWSFCIQAVKGGFGELLSGIYLQYFTKATLENYRKKVHTVHLVLKDRKVFTEDTPNHNLICKLLLNILG